MQAFLNDQKIKEKYITRMEKHLQRGDMAKGLYWEQGRGCAIGCTIEGFKHELYETELGVPRGVAFLEDVIFEELPNKEGGSFALRFLEVLNPGSNLSSVYARMIAWQFNNRCFGVKNIGVVRRDKELYELCKEMFGLYQREVAGEGMREQMKVLHKKVIDAWSDAGERKRREAMMTARKLAWLGARKWAWFRTKRWSRVWAWLIAGTRERTRGQTAVLVLSWAGSGPFGRFGQMKRMRAIKKHLLKTIANQI